MKQKNFKLEIKLLLGKHLVGHALIEKRDIVGKYCQ